MAAALATAGFLLTAGGAQAATAAASGELFYTTYSPAKLKKVAFTLDAAGLHLGSPAVVASLPNADGVVFAPDGSLLIGGESDNARVLRVDPRSGKVSSVRAGGPAAFHMMLDPSGNRVWTSGMPGQLSSVPLAPFRDGTELRVSGDVPGVTAVAFDRSGNAYFTDGDPDGPGDFGRIDLATGHTTRLLAHLPAAHGMTYDPYSDSLFLFGGPSVYQIKPERPQEIAATATLPGAKLDNGTVDGRGHLFVASNFGQLLFIDYSVTGRIGEAADRVQSLNLDPNLDDVAPLYGLGAAPTGGHRNWRLPLAGVGLVAAAGLTTVAIGRARRRPRRAPRPRRTRSSLPSWDLRRKEGHDD